MVVRNRLYVCVILAFSVHSNAEEMTGNDLRRILNQSEAYHQGRDLELKSDQIHTLLPEEKQSAPLAPPPPALSSDAANNGKENENLKGNNPQDNHADSASKKAANPNDDLFVSNTSQNNAAPPPQAAESRTNAPQNRASQSKAPNAGCNGLPPSWCTQQPSSKVQDKRSAHAEAVVQFGIRRGQAFRGRLEIKATNADFGTVEINVIQGVDGDLRRLPAGTKLFGIKQFNPGTRKLDIVCNSGITPDGFEFKNVKIVVKDQFLQSGLSGTITADKRIVDRAAIVGGTKLLQSAVSGLSSTTPAGSALSGTASSLISQGEKVAGDEVGKLTNIITVNPTDVYLYAEATF